MKVLPEKEQNIYPKTKKNLKALLAFYFDKHNLPQDNAIELIEQNPVLALNQIEFICKQLSEAWPIVFEKHYKNKTTVSNLLRYGFLAFMADRTELQKQSKTVQEITEEFIIYNME